MTARLIEGDCIAAMQRMALLGETVHAVVTDPPYELGFMGKRWDSTGIAFQAQTWRLCFDLLPPGGVVLDPFAGSGTTGAAALAEGMDAMLIEAEAEYQADIRRRLGLETPEWADLL